MKKILSLLLVLISIRNSYTQIEIILRRSFIDSLKNNAIIDVDFIIDKVKSRPNTPSKPD